MAFVPFSSTVMVEFLCSQDNQRLENTLYFRGPQGFAYGNMQGLAAFLIDWWKTNLSPQQSAYLSLNTVRVTDLRTDTGLLVEESSGLPAQGAGQADPLPNSVTWSLTFSTMGRGRSSRGRNYVLGLTEANVSGNTVAQINATAYVNAYMLLVGINAVAENWTWVVASRYSNGAPRPLGQVLDVVDVRYADLVVDCQRRRLPTRGK